MPKSVKSSRVNKKNFKVTIDCLNERIEQLRKTAVAENSSARSIHDIASNALKCGSRSLDNVAKKIAKLEDSLSKTKSTLSDVSKKLRATGFERDAATTKEKTTSNSLKAAKKDLAKVQKELAVVQKKLDGTKIESASRQSTREDSTVA